MEVAVEDYRVAASTSNQVGLRVQRSVLLRATAKGIARESGDTLSQRPKARRLAVSQSADAVKGIEVSTRTIV